jgi:2-oxo-4-hydroxy-4-carboxy-5-ureidoimidazoline decarboxylase
MPININDINGCDAKRFIELLGGIFEHSPWVAERSYALRPFESIADLHRKMSNQVRAASPGRQLDLLCQHPELAGKEADAGSLTRASQQEQAGAGLNQCSADELLRIKHLNQSYRDRFGFPFIIAVTGLDKLQIIAAMEQRIDNEVENEFATAIGEVEKIAMIRLDALIDE